MPAGMSPWRRLPSRGNLLLGPPDSLANPNIVNEKLTTLRTTDIGDWGKLIPKEPPQVKVSDEEFERWGFRDQDLMVTRTGTIGKCAIYESAMGPALPSAYLIRIRLDETK